MIRFLTLPLIVVAVLSAAGSSGLLTAIRNGDDAQVKTLLAACADGNIADRDGTIALTRSVIESDVKIMKRLIDNGAHVNAKSSLDSTALMYAATNLTKPVFCLRPVQT